MESGPEAFWSTTNLGEALPGVVSPLGWSIWLPAVDIGVRDCFARMGALSRKDVRVPERIEDRVSGVFYGRAALSATFFCRMGGRLPGTSPDAIAKQLLGEVPAGIPLESTLERLPFVAAKMPYALATIRRDVMARALPTKDWWTSWLARMDTLDEDGARGALDAARQKFLDMIIVQAGGVFIGVQSVYDQLLALIDKTGLDHAEANALVGGQGSHAETDIIVDLWAMGRGRQTLEQFLAEHGYHGPAAGEISSHVWREDATPVTRIAAQYAERGDEHDPSRIAAERTRARIAAERHLLSRLPSWQRPGAKLLLKMAVSRMPLRGVAKASYLQALDVGRASARRLGGFLVERGVLEDPEDAFLFTVQEHMQGLGSDAKRIADERRAQRAEFKRYDIPTHWNGNPVPFEIEPASSRATAEATTVQGIGASGGLVEGTVRIVHDPTFEDIEPDEVLVCVITDPSWASVLYLSSALVTDVGGLLSHAAVVAREMGVPCVVGTGDGTKVLRTGDRVRVDGNTGAVEILSRAPTPDESAEGVGTTA
jgi:pyruvate,water dikinase